MVDKKPLMDLPGDLYNYGLKTLFPDLGLTD